MGGIDTGDAHPIRRPPRRFPLTKQAEVNETLNDTCFSFSTRDQVSQPKAGFSGAFTLSHQLADRRIKNEVHLLKI
jgi:hypothetical protein